MFSTKKCASHKTNEKTRSPRAEALTGRKEIRVHLQRRYTCAKFMFNAQLKFVKFKKFSSTVHKLREEERAHIGLKATPAAAWGKLKISFYACRLQFLCADIQHIIIYVCVLCRRLWPQGVALAL